MNDKQERIVELLIYLDKWAGEQSSKGDFDLVEKLEHTRGIETVAEGLSHLDKQRVDCLHAQLEAYWNEELRTKREQGTEEKHNV